MVVSKRSKTKVHKIPKKESVMKAICNSGARESVNEVTESLVNYNLEEVIKYYHTRDQLRWETIAEYLNWAVEHGTKDIKSISQLFQKFQQGTVIHFVNFNGSGNIVSVLEDLGVTPTEFMSRLVSVMWVGMSDESQLPRDSGESLSEILKEVQDNYWEFLHRCLRGKDAEDSTVETCNSIFRMLNARGHGDLPVFLVHNALMGVFHDMEIRDTQTKSVMADILLDKGEGGLYDTCANIYQNEDYGSLYIIGILQVPMECVSLQIKDVVSLLDKFQNEVIAKGA